MKRPKKIAEDFKFTSPVAAGFMPALNHKLFFELERGRKARGYGTCKITVTLDAATKNTVFTVCRGSGNDKHNGL
jgi:hypothetical protein